MKLKDLKTFVNPCGKIRRACWQQHLYLNALEMNNERYLSYQDRHAEDWEIFVEQDLREGIPIPRRRMIDQHIPERFFSNHEFLRRTNRPNYEALRILDEIDFLIKNPKGK